MSIIFRLPPLRKCAQIFETGIPFMKIAKRNSCVFKSSFSRATGKIEWKMKPDDYDYVQVNCKVEKQRQSSFIDVFLLINVSCLVLNRSWPALPTRTCCTITTVMRSTKMASVLPSLRSNEED